MKGLRNIGLSFFLILIVACIVFASHIYSDRYGKLDFVANAGPVQAPEIQNAGTPFYYVFEINNFSQTITETHRLMSVLILPNRIVPFNYDFRRIAFIQVINVVNSCQK